MSNKKPEALQLADVVDEFDAQSEHMPLEIYSSISSELRRLCAVNQELLGACKAALSDDQPYIEKCRAAIAKANGSKVEIPTSEIESEEQKPIRWWLPLNSAEEEQQ